MCLLAICISYLEKYLFKVLCPVFKWVVCFVVVVKLQELFKYSRF